MDRYVMRHPELEHPALVPASAVPQHRGLGWVRVSGAIPADQVDQVDLVEYADAPDLDAPDLSPAPAAATTDQTPASPGETKE
jgi:hypothetical protein